MSALILGPVVFSSFEVPDRIELGGKQRLAVHMLPGGGRVVDAMGPDDAPVVWSGVFSGPGAAQRVRALDILRSAGEPLNLAWGDFVFDVVIAAFEARFERPNWIPYRIACLVLSDHAYSQLRTPPLAAQLVADLASAAACPELDVTAAQATIAAASATIRGTAAYGRASSSVAAAAAAAAALVSAGSNTLGSARSVLDVVASAGALARASVAHDYLRRAQSNLIRAGS